MLPVDAAVSATEAAEKEDEVIAVEDDEDPAVVVRNQTRRNGSPSPSLVAS